MSRATRPPARFLGECALSSSDISSNALATGAQVSINGIDRFHGDVVGASFVVVANNGSVLSTESTSLTGYPCLEAPIVGFELIPVG